MLLALSLIVLLSYGTQAMIGFGANIIALSLGAQLMPLAALLPAVVVLNLPHSVYLLMREHRHIDWRLLRRSILPLAGLGFALGLGLGRYLEGPILALGFGLMVTALACWELIKLRRAQTTSTLSRGGAVAFIGLAGITQGLFASGGPFLAYATARSGLNRRSFRITLIVVWFITNCLLALNFLMLDRYDASTLRLSLWLLPAVLIGLLLGDYAHHRIPERGFRICLYATLLASGLALVLGQP